MVIKGQMGLVLGKLRAVNLASEKREKVTRDKTEVRLEVKLERLPHPVNHYYLLCSL